MTVTEKLCYINSSLIRMMMLFEILVKSSLLHSCCNNDCHHSDRETRINNLDHDAAAQMMLFNANEIFLKCVKQNKINNKFLEKEIYFKNKTCINLKMPLTKIDRWLHHRGNQRQIL